MGMAHTRSVAVKFGAGKRPEFSEFVTSLGQEARRLVQPVRVLGASCLGAALLAWLLLFSSYSLDSTKSQMLCFAFFAFVLSPGFVFLWLGESLRELARLPRRLPRTGNAPSVAVETPQADAAEPAPTTWIRRAKARVDTVLVLWEHLSFSKDEIQQLVGPSRSMAFLAHPASAFLVAAAFVIGVFTSLGCVVAVFAGVLGRIF